MWHKKLLNCQLPSVCMYNPSSGILSAYELQLMTTFEDGSYPVLTAVGMIYSSTFICLWDHFDSFAEKGDYGTACERDFRRREAREFEQQVAYLKGLVTGGWNWVALALPSTPVMSMASQHPNANAVTPKGMQLENTGSVSTSVPGMSSTSRLVYRQRTAQVGHLGGKLFWDEKGGAVRARFKHSIRDFKALKACSKAHSLYSRLAERHLYTNIELWIYEAQPIYELYDQLSKKSRLPNYIRTLKITGNVPLYVYPPTLPIISMISQMVNLKSLDTHVRPIDLRSLFQGSATPSNNHPLKTFAFAI